MDGPLSTAGAVVVRRSAWRSRRTWARLGARRLHLVKPWRPWRWIRGCVRYRRSPHGRRFRRSSTDDRPLHPRPVEVVPAHHRHPMIGTTYHTPFGVDSDTAGQTERRDLRYRESSIDDDAGAPCVPFEHCRPCARAQPIDQPHDGREVLAHNRNTVELCSMVHWWKYLDKGSDRLKRSGTHPSNDIRATKDRCVGVCPHMACHTPPRGRGSAGLSGWIVEPVPATAPCPRWPTVNGARQVIHRLTRSKCPPHQGALVAPCPTRSVSTSAREG